MESLIKCCASRGHNDDADEQPPDEIFYDCIEFAGQDSKLRGRRGSWHGENLLTELGVGLAPPEGTECGCHTCTLAAEIQKEVVLRVFKARALAPRGRTSSLSFKERLDLADHDALAAELHHAFKDGSAAWVDGHVVARMLRATGGDVRLARAKLREASQWRTSTLQRWQRELVEHPLNEELQGFCSVVAIGRYGRPMVLGSLAWQRSGDLPTPVQCACAVEAALAGLGQDRKVDFVADCFGFQFLLNLNIGPFISLAKALDSYFAERAHRIVIVDMPRAAEWVWNALKPVLPPKTKLKIFFVRRNDRNAMDSALDDLCKDDAMRAHVDALLDFHTRDCEIQAPHMRSRKNYLAMHRSLVDTYMKQL